MVFVVAVWSGCCLCVATSKPVLASVLANARLCAIHWLVQNILCLCEKVEKRQDKRGFFWRRLHRWRQTSLVAIFFPASPYASAFVVLTGVFDVDFLGVHTISQDALLKWHKWQTLTRQRYDRPKSAVGRVFYGCIQQKQNADNGVMVCWCVVRARQCCVNTTYLQTNAVHKWGWWTILVGRFGA